ncbi:MFS general substrate transporter [Aspergillus saccharolyticus JOP 1030-1]|uniref:MFS general substrate transporter n=1 Tax=Aspergillus saccharolyticus JOP 1030-1 TaxID=1450539 RepID=A0A318ZKX3_9EURO|nr:MFS general substrate transporter [Aspergillus saccharolyticus JOP 1030-1]PYH47054.1 MFS general substrate transporter [Aspergillus saccharolyticus JOP 1030-1]
MADHKPQTTPWGYRWRSSETFILATVSLGIMRSMFLWSFIIPLLPYMLEDRIGLDRNKTQEVTFLVLADTALTSAVSSPLIGILADRWRAKRAFLLFSVVLATGCTISISLARNLYIIFIARFLQAIADNCMWIGGLAVIGRTFPASHFGRVMSVLSVTVAVGTSMGPVLSGIILENGGYWAAWSSAFVVLSVDASLRLLMIERPPQQPTPHKAPSSTTDPERAPLLSRTISTDSWRHQRATPDPDPNGATATAGTPEKSGLAYYSYLFRQPRFTAAITSYVFCAMLIASFDTTLPLHIRDVFGWGSAPAGLLFVGLQVPGILLTPACGWLKDRVGTRLPTGVGFLCLVPALWALGVPGDARFPWASGDTQTGMVLYVVAVVVIGCFFSPLNGVGFLEATLTINDLEAKHPGIFGPNGGHSRAQSIAWMGWTIGMFLGPIVSGLLVERVGYGNLNFIFGLLSLFFSVVAFSMLSGRQKDQD